jgi:hypothetical protein
MKRKLLLACASAALPTAIACATADQGTEQRPTDGGSLVVTEASVAPDASDGGTTELVPVPQCSDAGWCPTELPDPDLMFKDVWPLAGRAFAIAESPTLGIRLLEWEDSRAKWKYIDDNSQNQPGGGDYAGRIWAPNPDEVYYGVAFGTIQHGTRPVPPSTTWTWEQATLTDHSPDLATYPAHDHGRRYNPELEISYPTLGVWGIGGDVYAWYANTIYRRTSQSGGPPTWVAEHMLLDTDAVDEHVLFLGAAGTSADDVWFLAVRQRTLPDGADVGCPLITRKTSKGYERIFDGLTAAGCTERMGVPSIPGAAGWLMDLQALPGNRFAGIKGGRDVIRISQSEPGVDSVDAIPIDLGLYDRRLYSVYSPSQDQIWASGMGIVIRAQDVWDGGAFGVSTISLNGGPINRPLYQIRGTSDTNLWAVGVRYALHKTTH